MLKSFPFRRAPTQVKCASSESHSPNRAGDATRAVFALAMPCRGVVVEGSQLRFAFFGKIYSSNIIRIFQVINKRIQQFVHK